MSLNMHPVFQLNYNKLYLGNIRLQTSQMRAVLTVLDVNVKVEGSFHKWIPATDAPDFNLKKHFDEGADYIHEHLQRGNVLVHCYAGISRSASIVMAYLIKYQGHTTQTALKHLKAIRYQVEPNRGFMNQLKEYENKNRNIKSYLQDVSQVSSPRAIHGKSFLGKLKTIS